MTALAEALAEVERLEAIDADTGLGEKGLANLEKARTAVESLKRQERRERAAARQTLANKLSAHEAVLNAAYEALKAFVQARRELDRARSEAAAAERAAKAAGVLEHSKTHRAAEITWFDRPQWRSLHDEARQLLNGSLL
jgi:hypothetical protein